MPPKRRRTIKAGKRPRCRQLARLTGRSCEQLATYRVTYMDLDQTPVRLQIRGLKGVTERVCAACLFEFLQRVDAYARIACRLGYEPGPPVIIELRYELDKAALAGYGVERYRTSEVERSGPVQGLLF